MVLIVASITAIVLAFITPGATPPSNAYASPMFIHGAAQGPALPARRLRPFTFSGRATDAGPGQTRSGPMTCAYHTGSAVAATPNCTAADRWPGALETARKQLIRLPPAGQGHPCSTLKICSPGYVRLRRTSWRAASVWRVRRIFWVGGVAADLPDDRAVCRKARSPSAEPAQTGARSRDCRRAEPTGGDSDVQVSG